MSLRRLRHKLKKSVRRLLLKSLNDLGYDLVNIKPIKSHKEGYSYERIRPQGTYAPWQSDKDFKSAYNMIRDNTLVDIYRCYNLWHLADQVSHLSGDYLEVGVWRGGTGCLLAKRAMDRDHGAHVYLCDTFEGVVNAGNLDPDYGGGEHSDTSPKEVERLARTMGLTNVKILKGMFPEESANEVEDSRFKFCHIDVDVYNSAKNTAEWVWSRLSQGGIMVFDDFGFRGTAGVTQFVNENLGIQDRLVIYNLNGQAVVIKLR